MATSTPFEMQNMAQSFGTLWIFLLVLVQVSLGAGAQASQGPGLLRRQDPATIGTPKDSFLVPPPGFEKAPLGTILRYRPVPKPVRLLRLFPLKLLGAWQILYRTQSTVGDPETTVVTILAPHNPKPGNVFSLSYLTNAAYRPCSPSFLLQATDPDDNLLPHFQTLLAVAALNEGWYVSIADDGGPQAAQPSGLQQGYSTLDSIRAVLASGNFTGIKPNATTTLFGYSGASVSVGWATEVQPYYAPELKIAGAAIGGIVANLKAPPEFDMTWYTAFTPTTLLGLSHGYANFSNWLKENLDELHEPEFRRGEAQCTMSNFEDFPYVNLSKFFKRGWKAMDDPIPASVLKWGGIMGLRATPKIPWFLYQNVGDKLSPMDFSDRLVDQHCRNGALIHYEKNMKPLEHGIAPILRFPAAFSWLRDRHEGRPLASECRTSTVAIDGFEWLNDGELAWSIRMIGQNILAALGVPIVQQTN